MKPIFFCKDVITYFAMQFVNELNFRIILIRSMALTMMARRNKKILSWWWKYWINSFLVPDPPTSPQLLSDPTSTSVFSGERVKLTCVSGRGNPLPKLTWMRDGNPLRQETGNYNLVSTVCKLLFTSEKTWRRVKSPQIKLFKAPTTAFFTSVIVLTFGP